MRALFRRLFSLRWPAKPELDRDAAERAAFAALSSGNIEAAVKIAQRHRKAAGLNTTKIVSALEDIFAANPGILAAVSQPSLNALKIAAAMHRIWGYDRSTRRWLPPDAEIGTRLSAEVGMRMILYAVHQKAEMQRWDAAGTIKRVDILCAGSASCTECQKLARRHYRRDSLPELPYPACTNAMGCRCVYLPII